LQIDGRFYFILCTTVSEILVLKDDINVTEILNTG
jgi:hypothetical protein